MTGLETFAQWCNSGTFNLGVAKSCLIRGKTHSTEGKPCLVLTRTLVCYPMIGDAIDIIEEPSITIFLNKYNFITAFSIFILTTTGKCSSNLSSSFSLQQQET